MKYDLSEFDKRVEAKFLRRFEHGNLVAYDYTDKCTYDKAWDEYTSVARGIVFEKSTGELIAKPFPKFFNLGEMPETYVGSLPNESYTVTEKMDGSLGIIYYYEGEWRVNTRGSFSSEQAIKAKEMLSNYKFDSAFQRLTYLVEIVYPENKIVVNYGDEEKLVLLTAYNIWGEEVPYKTLTLMSKTLNIPLANVYHYTIEEMMVLKKTMPKDEEGFVVRYESGLRVKIKGDEYLKVHRIISCLSPLSAHEAMVNGVVRRDYLEQIPEEYRNEFQPIVEKLEMSYKNIYKQIEEDALQLPKVDLTSKEGLKTIGLFTQGDNKLNHPTAMFNYLKCNQTGLDKYIMKVIRPNGNVLS